MNGWPLTKCSMTMRVVVLDELDQDAVELTLIEDEGETLLTAGDAAGFKAGVKNGHHLVNKSNRDAIFLEIGTRSKHERAEYPDVDLVAVREETGGGYTHKDGKPYPK